MFFLMTTCHDDSVSLSVRERCLRLAAACSVVATGEMTDIGDIVRVRFLLRRRRVLEHQHVLRKEMHRRGHDR